MIPSHWIQSQNVGLFIILLSLALIERELWHSFVSRFHGLLFCLNCLLSRKLAGMKQKRHLTTRLLLCIDTNMLLFTIYCELYFCVSELVFVDVLYNGGGKGLSCFANLMKNVSKKVYFQMLNFLS